MVLDPIEERFEKVTRYHYWLFFFIFACKIPVTWHLLSVIIVVAPVSWTCDGVKEKCPCANPVWDHSVFIETSTTKYNLICERKWMLSAGASVFYFGLLIGAFTFGYIADKYGRLRSYCLACVAIVCTGSIVGFMPTILLFTIARFAQGTGVGGCIVTSYVLLVEYCGTNFRERVSGFSYVTINLGHATMAGVSYFFRDERYFHLVSSLAVIFCASTYFMIYESPKWMMDKDYLDRAAKVMKKICKINKKPCEGIREEMAAYNAQRTKVERISLRNIFKYRKLTVSFFCMAFEYFVCGMGYYGVSQFIGKMGGNIHFNVFVAGMMLIPGSLLSSVLLTILGRKPFLVGAQLVAGTTMLVVVFIPDSFATGRMLLACLGNTFFHVCFVIVFLYGVELFPTSVRNSVLGTLSVVSRAGAMVSPVINGFNQTMAGAFFGVMAIIAAFLAMFLPETKNTPLPATLEECENMGKRTPTTATPTVGTTSK